MSLFDLSLPRLEFIIFELLKIDTTKQKNDPAYQPESISVVNLAVLPESLNYKIQGRDSITQTDKVFTQKFSLAPERVSFTGSFGEDVRSVNGNWLDGWERLKQFENLVKTSKSVDNETIYAVNYYDFLFQRFGAINIESWSLGGNAKTNSNLITYQLNFSITDPLIISTSQSQFVQSIVTGLFDRTMNLSLEKNLFTTGIDLIGIATEIFTGLMSAVNMVQGVVKNTHLSDSKLIKKSGAF